MPKREGSKKKFQTLCLTALTALTAQFTTKSARAGHTSPFPPGANFADPYARTIGLDAWFRRTNVSAEDPDTIHCTVPNLWDSTVYSTATPRLGNEVAKKTSGNKRQRCDNETTKNDMQHRVELLPSVKSCLQALLPVAYDGALFWFSGLSRYVSACFVTR
jgi:hypothetical protein